jgi:hypothetical protein
MSEPRRAAVALVMAVVLGANCASAALGSTNGGSSTDTNFLGALQSDTSGSNSSGEVSNSSQSFGTDSSATSAQSSDQSNQSTQGASSNTQSATTASLAVAALSSVGLLVWNFVPSVQLSNSGQSLRSSGQSSGRRYRQIRVAAMRYFRAQSDQLLQDLALGAGPTVDDLAGGAGVRAENVRRLGQLLRQHRAELVSMLEPQHLTEDGAGQVLRRIGEIAWEDPALREDGERYLANASTAP